MRRISRQLNSKPLPLRRIAGRDCPARGRARYSDFRVFIVQQQAAQQSRAYTATRPQYAITSMQNQFFCENQIFPLWEIKEK